LGGALGGGAGSLPPFFRLYLPSSTQNRHFISFFLQKVVAALQEPVVLVGKNSQLGAIELGR
jgi:hypothetical protein